MDEQIVLVDQAGNPIGIAPKLSSHNDHTPLHLAFSCYIFNPQGLFLMTRRTASKKVWPGVWTNSVCGHPAPEEEITDAIRRRSLYELGIDDIEQLEVVLPDYRYVTPPFNGIIENEVCPVYMAITRQEPRPNPDEVSDYEWLALDKVSDLFKANPEDYSYWFKDQLPEFKKQRLVK
jgi:isopentenyl-diphosphate delta-isomerase